MSCSPNGGAPKRVWQARCRVDKKSDKKGIWKRTGGSAVPASTIARAQLYSVKDGSEFVIPEIRRMPMRNLEQLRMFWALCEIVAENDSSYVDQYAVRWDMFEVLNLMDERID